MKFAHECLRGFIRMKRCPECGRDYDDDSLRYCLDDGASLLFGPATSEPATALLPNANVVDGTPTLQHGSSPVHSQRSNERLSIGRPLVALLAVAALLSLGALSVWYFRSAAAADR